jgi:hypothetical protein
MVGRAGMRKVAIIGGLLLAFFLTWVAGHWTGGYQERHQHYLDERKLIDPILANDADFDGVRIMEETGPGGGILLYGNVKSLAARDRLKAELVRVFGEQRAKVLIEWDGLWPIPNR